MPFASKTTDEIRDGFIRDVRLAIPGAVTVSGSDYYAQATAISVALAPIYSNGKYLANQALPDTADEANLVRFGFVWGVPRQGAQFASGSITVLSSIAQTIAAGSFLKNLSTGARYKTVGAVSVPANVSTPVTVVATDSGASGNATSGILTFESAPPGVNPTATIVSISGGDSEWSLSRWAGEIIKVMRARPGSGNVAHVIAICNTVPGVEQAFVYPALRGPGTLDIAITTSAATGSRVPGTTLLNQVRGALQAGIKTSGGVFVPGIPEDVFANTVVSAPVAQPTGIVVGYKANAVNPFESWPSTMAVATPATWFTVASSASLTSFVTNTPSGGTAPVIGNQIGVYFPSVGYCKGVVSSVTGAGPWTVTVSGWSPSPTESAVPVGAVISPWNSQLPSIATAAASFFAALGPGQATPLTVDDVTRRVRWPLTTEISPFTGLPQWPTDVTSRLSAQLAANTDGVDFTVSVASGYSGTPAIPAAAYIGAPPSILTLAKVAVIPIP